MHRSRHSTSRCSLPREMIVSALLLVLAGPAGAADLAAANADTGLTLSGDKDSTVLQSLTIEGENRIQFDFERPELSIALDPTQAPGLAWGDARDVINRTVPDRTGPLLGLSRTGLSPYRPHPWLDTFQSGPVARFRPQAEGVVRWNLTVMDARSEIVREFAGNGVPGEIDWDGRDSAGQPALPGLTYSYVFTAYDRAGNRRRFVGDGFQISPFRLTSDVGPVLVCSGDALTSAVADRGAAPTAVQEIASWLNRSLAPDAPIIITATAASSAGATQLGDRLRLALLPLLPGDPARVSVRTAVLTGAPPAGSLRVEPAVDAPTTP